METLERQCLWCGETFSTTRVIKQYCDESCRHRAKKKRDAKRYNCVCENCSLEFAASTQRPYCSVKCSNEGQSCGEKRVYTCKNCGVAFTPKAADRRSYCSRECAFADYSSWLVGTPVDPQNEYDRMFREWAQSSVLQVRGECEYCRKPTYTNTLSKYCSRECSSWSNTERKIHGGRKAVTYKCKECGVTFQPPFRDKRRTFCSSLCNKRYSRRHYPGNFRSRARYHGVEYEPINRLEIYNRDKWVCQLCGKRVSKSAKYPDEESPTIDHIIPMSKGGGHIKANVQLAHWSCNVLKGDDESMNPEYQQLLLIG